MVSSRSSAANNGQSAKQFRRSLGPKLLSITCNTFLLLAVAASLFLWWIALPFYTLGTYQRPPWTGYPVVDHFTWDGVRPLKISFFNWGSRGDHQPTIALGLELARRGHNVTILCREKYRGIYSRHKSLRLAHLSDSHLWELAETFGKSDGEDFIKLTTDYVFDSFREHVDEYSGVAEDADVLIGAHAIMCILQDITVAEIFQKPLFLLTHDLTLPTTQYSFDPGESRVMDYGKITNMMNHRIFGIIFGAAALFGPNSEVRRVRTELGLTTPWPFMEVMNPFVLADFPIFSTADPTLWPPPSDRPPHWYSTGFFVTRDDTADEPPEYRELQAWIDERKAMHDRPMLYFGQGSFRHHEREIFTDILLDALEKLDMDAISLANTVDGRAPPPHLKVVAELDSEVIFPQCNVITHHGGAGTASQVIRSGKPGLCIPSMPFQRVWGGQLEDYGAGVLLLPDDMQRAWEKNRTNILVTAVRKAMSVPVRRAATVLGKAARGKGGGVKLAADKMIEHLQQLRERKVSQSTHAKSQDL